jgi:serine/threonine protein kinase
MSLTAGTRIGPYEVSSQIGEGGMGVVYRARDTKLKREVLARILEREPDWSLLPAKVPLQIQKLLRLCLEKDPRQRRSDAVRLESTASPCSLPTEGDSRSTERPRPVVDGKSGLSILNERR